MEWTNLPFLLLFMTGYGMIMHGTDHHDADTSFSPQSSLSSLS